MTSQNFSRKTCLIRTRTRHTYRRKSKKKYAYVLLPHMHDTHARTSFVAASWGLGNREGGRERVSTVERTWVCMSIE